MADSFKLIVLNVISKFAHKNQFIIQVSRRIIDNQLAILYYFVVVSVSWLLSTTKNPQ